MGIFINVCIPLISDNIMILKILQNKKIIAGSIVVALLAFLLYASIPLISTFFGAVVLAFIFRPIDKRLKKMTNARISALVIIIISLILIILPLIFLINGLIEQVSLLPEQIEQLTSIKGKLQEKFPALTLEVNEKKIIDQVMPLLTKSISPLFTNFVSSLAYLFLLFFLLYYLVLYYEYIKKFIMKNLPFSRKNNLIIIERFKEITYSTMIGTFFIALIQGGFIAINFYLLGIPNALFWGSVTMIISFIPIIGTPIIWGPASIMLIISGSTVKGVTLIIIGILISSVDNILRPIINQRYGRVHPLISIVGLYIGILQFGLVGIFIGPLLIAYFILFSKLYIEEHL
jgi:predicted PurR-regulated permease PerM